MTQSLYDLVGAIQTKMDGISAVRATGNESMTDGIPQTPLYEIYGNSGSGAHQSGTSRNTFTGALKLREWEIVIDCYVQQLSDLGQDYAALHRAMSDIMSVLDTQTEHVPSFDQPDVKTFSYTWTREVIQRAGARYLTYRFRLLFMVT